MFEKANRTTSASEEKAEQPAVAQEDVYMDRFEKAQKVCEATGVSFDDARTALDECAYDVLDAIVWLERQGKVDRHTASYTTATAAGAGSFADEMSQAQNDYERATKKGSFSKTLNRIMDGLRRLCKKGLDTSFVVTRQSRQLVSIPVLVLVILMLLFFWWMVPAIIIGLFFDCKYRFEGFDHAIIDVNDIAERASEGASALKREMAEKHEKKSE